MTASWIAFNSNKSFYTGTLSPGSTQVDALSVAVHEWGHNVVLGHIFETDTAYSSDVMWLYLSAGVKKRNLTAHDKDGIIYFYGPAPYGGT